MRCAEKLMLSLLAGVPLGCGLTSTRAPATTDDGGSLGLDARGKTSTPPEAGHATFDAGPTSSDAGPPTFDAGPATSDAGPPTFDAGPAALLSLVVSPLTLTPAFSSSVHDYYVRCPAASNSVTVSASAPSGTIVELVQPIAATSSSSSLTVAVGLEENDAVVVSASLGASTEAYWVRCLGPGFPLITMNDHPSAGTPTPGYYLIGDTSRLSSEVSYAMVVDGNGVPVWYSTTSTGREPVNVESLTTNVVSFVPFFDYTFATTSEQYEVFNLAGTGATYVESHGEPLDAHELQLLSNGDYLVLSDPITKGVDLTGLGTFGPDEDIIGCNVQEVSPSGAVVCI
jgi:hypothetical protein